MPDISVLIRVLADTSGAQGNVDRLIESLGRAAPIGTAGVAGAALLKTAFDFQSSMATIQTAYNSADFAPGTEKYKAAYDTLVDQSTRLATPFDELAKVYSQGGFVDDFGNKLPTEKVNEYVDTMARLSKVSTDNLQPTDIGQRVDVFEKLYGQTNFAAVGSAISAESGIHNQGEGPMLDSAIAIAQYGAEMGVTQAQALGIGNYLTDIKAGGLRGGASVGRMILRMDASADSILDPEEAYKTVKSHREASERVDDLDESLRMAEAKRAEMYDSRGRLKRNYIQHPAEKMAMDDRVSKLQRELGDAKSDQAHVDDAKTGRGQMNLAAMAATAGEDPTAFAQEFKTEGGAMDVLLKFVTGLHKLDPSRRGAAIRAAGITNIKDLLTIDTMAARPEVGEDYVKLAQGEIGNPTDLPNRSDIPLGTTKSKAQDVINAGQAGLAAGGEPIRQEVDKSLTAALNDTPALLAKIPAAVQSITDALQGSGLPQQVKDVADAFSQLPPVISTVLTAAAPWVIKGALHAPGPASVAGGLIDVGTRESDNWNKFQRGTENPGQFVGHAIEDFPMPGANAIGNTIAGASGDSSINIGGITLHLYDMANGGMVQQAAAQAGQQVYSGIMAAWNQSRGTPSSQLGGAH